MSATGDRLGASMLLDVARLLRWLGPWADGRVPAGVARSTTACGRSRAHIYRPRDRAPTGAYLIAPGLHFLGPDDPRMDRFCRVLAASGLLVLAPFLPDFLRLRLAPTATDDLAAAWDELEALAAAERLPPPAIFSISFGASPAIALAGRASHRERIGALVIFGGFADFRATVRFAITGVSERDGERLVRPRDPLNSPAVFLNLLPYLEIDGDPVVLERGWLTMIERTWGRMELKAPRARDPFANAIANELPDGLRRMFLVGCGMEAGAAELLERGLEAAGSAFDFFDPRQHLPNVRAPLFLVHGRDDDVIPWFESEKLRDALAAGHPHRLLVTGMASHTSMARPKAADLAREVVTLLATAHAICAAPRGLRTRARRR